MRLESTSRSSHPRGVRDRRDAARTPARPRRIAARLALAAHALAALAARALPAQTPTGTPASPPAPPPAPLARPSVPPPPARAPAIALVHVTIVDPADPQVRRDRTVLVRDRRIVAVGPTRGPGAVRIPPDARRIDAGGRWLIPGLWDAHVHAFDRPSFAGAFLGHGITAVRDMGDAIGPLVAWRAGIAADTLLGPRLVFPGGILDGLRPAPWQPFFRQVTDSASAERLVDSLAGRGADFVKPYTTLSADQFRWVAGAARRRGLPFGGHVPFAVDAGDAAALGMRSQEHLYGVLLAGSTAAAALRDSLAAVIAGPQATGVYRAAFAQVPTLLATQDPARVRRLHERLARAGTFVVPTLVVLEPPTRLDDSAFVHDPALRHIPAVMRSFTDPAAVRAQGRGVDTATERALFAALRASVGAMHRAGVRIVAGSDAPNPFTPPGAALHRELALLVGAGLSPRAALRAATTEAAALAGMADSVGRVRPGYLADLVLLDGDPLAGIENTRRIHGVLRDGRWLDAAFLAALRAQALAAAEGLTRY